MDDNINEILSDYCIEAADSFVGGILKETALSGFGPVSAVRDLTKIIRSICKKYDRNISAITRKELPEVFQDYRKILVSAVELCLSHGLTIFEIKDSKETAKSLAKSYFAEHGEEFQSDADQLELYLAEILRACIDNLQEEYQKDPNFQKNWELWVQKSIVHFQEVVDQLSQEFHGLEKRMTAAETKNSEQDQRLDILEKSGYQKNTVEECHQELKGLWTDFPFLEHGRKQPKTLNEFYKLPHGERAKDIHAMLQTFLTYGTIGDTLHKRMLVVLGEPGIGKSTLITYLLNNCTISENRTVRVFRLREFKNFNVNNLCGSLLEQMGLLESDLNHSVLILDGLDEIQLNGQYTQFLEKLRTRWARNSTIKDFSLMVTCRNTRISDYGELRCPYVVLSALENDQIEKFAIDYLGYCPENLKQCIDENEDLHEALGIPIILYMVLALDIAVSPNATMAEIYQEIFTPEENSNSIYYRSYTENHPMVTPEMAQKIHEFSKQAAVKMWDLRPEEATLTQEEWTSLAEELCGDSDWKNLLVGQYFVEGQEGHELCFVHRSMQEYFVALSFFDAIQNITSGRKTPEQLFEEIKLGTGCTLTPFADVLGVYHLPGSLEIVKNLQYLLEKSSVKVRKDGNWWRQMIDCFCKDGLAEAAIHRWRGGERGIGEETTRFFNLLWIGRECLKLCGEKAPYQLLPERYHDDSSIVYFHLPFDFIEMDNINLNCTHLEDARLVRAYLLGVYLEQAHLERAHLEQAYLYGANLEEAHLKWANLEGAHLERAHLERAYLYGAHLEGAILEMAHLEGAYLVGATLPDGRIYKDALKSDGPDMMLQFTDPDKWNELHPDKQVDPTRYYW